MNHPLRQCLGSLTVTVAVAVALALGTGALAPVHAQFAHERYGEVVPRDIREMYDRGLQYLVSRQSPEGDWPGYQQGPGVTGLCVMALLASGEDPNFGLYSAQVRKGLRSIVRSQNPTTGYLGSSMYHHSFAMLALAEAYGAVDERNLWPESGGANQRSVGAALELAVRTAVTSQKKNKFGGWRYSPDATDADTSVSGAVLVGLLAARNAGIEVPDEAIDRAISYYQSMTADGGQVAYSGGMGGMDSSQAREAIATLVFAVARRSELPQYKAALSRLTENLENQEAGPYLEYTRYYRAQALFQGDVESWEKWNRRLVEQLKSTQQADGSIPGQFGPELGTSMSLLALALNYRFLPIYER